MLHAAGARWKVVTKVHRYVVVCCNRSETHIFCHKFERFAACDREPHSCVCCSVVGYRVLREQAKRRERDSEQRRCSSVRIYLKRILETARDNASTSTLRQARAAALTGR